MEQNVKFIDYYEVLGVWPAADVDAIKKAYFKLAKMHHPDVVGETDGGEGVDFKLINEAFSVLSDANQRREFDERLKARGGGSAPEKRVADKRSAHLAFEQARAAMRQNRYDKAAVLLKAAVKYDDSNPAYHSWYGFSLGVLRTQLHEARDACKKALEMEFYNADFHANLGFVYMQAGLTRTAMESFEEALKWDPDHPVALRYSKDAKGGKPGAPGAGGLLGLLRRFTGGGPAKKVAPPAAKKKKSTGKRTGPLRERTRRS
jgi:curved DNA-binding protein CbpA